MKNHVLDVFEDFLVLRTYNSDFGFEMIVGRPDDCLSDFIKRIGSSDAAKMVRKVVSGALRHQAAKKRAARR